MADPTYTFVPTDDIGVVRMLVNDVSAPWIFSDEEITAFLTLEGKSVKRAAAQAIDTNADNEALASKVLKSQDLATDGAKVADALRKRAAALRQQADVEDGDFFEIVDVVGPSCGPELTGRQPWWPL
jgi:hypothetical protein